MRMCLVWNLVEYSSWNMEYETTFLPNIFAYTVVAQPFTSATMLFPFYAFQQNNIATA